MINYSNIHRLINYNNISNMPSSGVAAGNRGSGSGVNLGVVGVGGGPSSGVVSYDRSSNVIFNCWNFLNFKNSFAHDNNNQENDNDNENNNQEIQENENTLPIQTHFNKSFPKNNFNSNDNNHDNNFNFGLYDPQAEKDSCGVGFIVNIEGIASHQILKDARVLSSRLVHRGACGCDNDTGDGAGILVTIPHEFYKQQLKKDYNVELPSAGCYATGLIFMDDSKYAENERSFSDLVSQFDLKVLCWRTIPTDNRILGELARMNEPLIKQVFLVSNSEKEEDPDIFRKRIYHLRKKATHLLSGGDNGRFYICSISTRVVVYKGQLTSHQLWDYYLDLINPEFHSFIALIHTRFSTNTFPSWERSQPLRTLAHNGEINTLRGNVNLMKAREGTMNADGADNYFTNYHLKELYPVVEENLSDSGTFDCVLEFLNHVSGRSIHESIISMVPEAWQNDECMDEDKKLFYKWVSCFMEPWDGPALLAFTDGRYVGAILDRNGLRPSRYYVTKDNCLIMASEVGVYQEEEEAEISNIVYKGRLKPGKMLLIDTELKKVIKDKSIKEELIQKRISGSRKQIHGNLFTLEDILENDSSPEPYKNPAIQSLTERKEAARDSNLYKDDFRLGLYGYTNETITLLLIPMILNKKEALGSMGNDAPLACLSCYQPLIFDYFKQLFAQVTNPPIDPIRESIVMSVACPIGPEANILNPNDPNLAGRMYLQNPILSNAQLASIKNNNFRGWKTKVIDITYEKGEVPVSLIGEKGLKSDVELTIERMCGEVDEAISEGFKFIVLSDRRASVTRVPISTLIACGSLHHHLIENRKRNKIAIVAETGEAREVHHMCLLLGYGADAICPYIVYDVGLYHYFNLWKEEDGPLEMYLDKYDNMIYENYSTAVERGILKVMAKMGISTLQSYKGAQIFEAVGLNLDIVDRCFKNTISRIGGINFNILQYELEQRHSLSFINFTKDKNGSTKSSPAFDLILRNPGNYHWRNGGEVHINDPSSIANLQDAVKSEDNYESYEKFSQITDQLNRRTTIRGQFNIDTSLTSTTQINVDEVEPAAEIIKRFSTGAMSFGSISYETHTTIAKAMNRIGGKSNTGEGGENEERFRKMEDGEDAEEFFKNNARSAIKQVASGRFGVTIEYLVNSDEIQIKMAQGAKPGEGGELPGYKVTEEIAKTRHSIPYVGLISPPPHHDIYSIEDLKELIYNLRCTNPNSRISVKLVSEFGIGVISSGVVKCGTDHIVVSGHDGGTGASSWTGIKSAGLPWELGIIEVHQTLVYNDLRSRVKLQIDGNLRTGKDIVIGGILGADEFGFSTMPLITLGCIMMRKCHLNTCPVGIATQDPILREKFAGKPEHLINYFFYLSNEIREYLAKLGIRKFQDLIGRYDLIKVINGFPNPTPGDSVDYFQYKSSLLNLKSILVNPLELRPNVNIVGGSVVQFPDFPKHRTLDNLLIQKFQEGKAQLEKAREGDKILTLENVEIYNSYRSFSTTFSHFVISKFNGNILAKNNWRYAISIKGNGGQNFGSFLIKNVSLTLEGDSNDFVGKGLCGGEIVIYPPGNLIKIQQKNGENNFGGTNYDYNNFYQLEEDEIPEETIPEIEEYIKNLKNSQNENEKEEAEVENNEDCGNCEVPPEETAKPKVPAAKFRSEKNIIVGNVCLYGAVEGKVFIRGVGGERFCVRNSGATAVIEGVGDHGCEYMTGGIVLILGKTGKNFGAGMSGGVAYIYDPNKKFERKCNLEMIQILKVEKGYDVTLIKKLLVEFHQKSGSNVASEILRDFSTQVSHFLKVLPYEYNNALKKIFSNKKMTDKCDNKTKSSDDNNRSKDEQSLPIQKDKAENVIQDIEDILGKKGVSTIIPKTNGFMKLKRFKKVYRPVNVRIKDFKEILNPEKTKDSKYLKLQAARCMDCGVPFCHESKNYGCPLGNLIPKWNDLIYNGKYGEALKQLQQTNNFPEFTGRVCPAPCESACTLNLYNNYTEPVNIKNIELFIIENAFKNGMVKANAALKKTKDCPEQKIAIIGSGPAGLAAADQLNKCNSSSEKNYRVFVYERNNLPGGLLQYGIPNMKLDKVVIKRRIDLMKEEGVTFITNCNVGVDITMRELYDQYDAILFCIGSTRPRDLPVKGRSLGGIYFAMEYLEMWQKFYFEEDNKNLDREVETVDKRIIKLSELDARGKDIVVIGGGDTGCDCIATTLRQDAKSITSFEILDRPEDTRNEETNPWPQFLRVFKSDYGHEEVQHKFGHDPRKYNILTKEFVESTTNPGNITCVKTVKVEWYKEAAEGAESGAKKSKRIFNWRMNEIPGSEEEIKCDLVLLAMGFLGPNLTPFQFQPILEGMEPSFQFLNERANIRTKTDAIYTTDIPKIFAAGDCRRGQSLVVWAITEGRQAARDIDNFLCSVKGGKGGKSYLPTIGGIILA